MPPAELTMEGLLTGISEALQSRPSFHWVSPEILLEQGVEPWSEIPLRSPASIRNMTFDNSRALEAGLRLRLLAETALATVACAADRPMPGSAGLSSAREAELLSLWSRRASRSD